MSYSYSQSGLGAEDFYGPPQPGQTDAQYQQQMSPAIAVTGIAALSLVNPLVGLVAGAAWLMSSTHTKTRKSEKHGGH